MTARDFLAVLTMLLTLGNPFCSNLILVTKDLQENIENEKRREAAGIGDPEHLSGERHQSSRGSELTTPQTKRGQPQAEEKTSTGIELKQAVWVFGPWL